MLLLIPTIFPLISCAPRAVRAEPVIPTLITRPTTTATAIIATSLTFIAEADAQVRESDPHLNEGKSIELMVDGEDDPAVESFIRFNVTGISGPIHNALLRVYASGNASGNAPAVYATSTLWSETALTWSARPDRVTGPLDDKDSIGDDFWVEYDVTISVADNQIYSFVFVADSDDAVVFSSRESSHPPELVITLANGPTARAAIPVTGATLSLNFTPTPARTNLLTFIADMDARVKESNPDKNFANSSILQADHLNDPGVESYIRFTIAGISGRVLSARLRMYVTTNGSRNGPAVYSTESSWTELGITWNLRPARTSSAVDNKDRIRAKRWVEYDVTSLVQGNGKQSFVLAADSQDAVNFSSREGNHPPELVIHFISGPALTPYP